MIHIHLCLYHCIGLFRVVDTAYRDGHDRFVGCTIRGYLEHLRRASQGNPIDRTVVRILETAETLDGSKCLIGDSAWIAWLREGLRPRNKEDGKGLAVATVHSIKGQEWPNVILYDEAFVSTDAFC